MTNIPDRRAAPVRRAVSSLFMRDGEIQESKLFASFGKAACLWIIVKFPVELITHENALLFVLLIIVAPDLLKKFITMRSGAPVRSGYTERTEHTEHATTTTTAKGAPFIP